MHNLQINAQRLWDSIMETAQIGGTAKKRVETRIKEWEKILL